MSNEYCLASGEVVYIDVSSASGLSIQSNDFANLSIEATNYALPNGVTGIDNVLTPSTTGNFTMSYEVMDNISAVWDSYGVPTGPTSILDVSPYRYVRVTATAAACISLLMSCDVPANALEPLTTVVPPVLPTRGLLRTTTDFSIDPLYTEVTIKNEGSGVIQIDGVDLKGGESTTWDCRGISNTLNIVTNGNEVLAIYHI